MSERVGDVFRIQQTADAPCEMCGEMRELRPYGPNEENVCFGCGSKDPEAMSRALLKRMSDAKLVVVAPPKSTMS